MFYLPYTPKVKMLGLKLFYLQFLRELLVSIVRCLTLAIEGDVALCRGLDAMQT